MSEATDRARALECLAAHGMSDGFNLPVLPGYIVAVNPDAVIAAMIAFAAEARSHDGEWVLVPKEPTEAMLKAGGKKLWSADRGFAMQDVWSAMVSAVPLFDEGRL